MKIRAGQATIYPSISPDEFDKLKSDPMPGNPRAPYIPIQLSICVPLAVALTLAGANC